MDGKAVRMNISIPADLRQRMRPHDREINWSAVAAEAFRAVVDGGNRVTVRKGGDCRE